MPVSRLSPVLFLSSLLVACGGGSDDNSGAVAIDGSFADDFVQDNVVNNYTETVRFAFDCAGL